MKQEYLLHTKEDYEKIRAYRPNNILFASCEIGDSGHYVAAFYLKNNDREAAKLLSNVNTFVKEHIPAATVLTDECSAYFNKTLYPQINSFERKLRKLLYLKSAVYTDSEAVSNIKDLEKKDLGEIYVLLFTDEHFIKETKAKVNDKSWSFSKQEIIETVSSLNECVLWDKLFDKETVTELRSRFQDVKQFRNDTMHAHNIDYKTFAETERLFGIINSQLDQAINELMPENGDHPKLESPDRYNETLSTALKNASLAERFIQQYGDKVLRYNSTYDKWIPEGETPEEYLSRIESISKTLTPEYLRSIERTLKVLSATPTDWPN